MLVKLFLIYSIKLYQRYISPFLGKSCRFYPTCSEYTIESLQKHGCFLGLWLSLKRIAKCGPWHCGGVDLVPERAKASKDNQSASSRK